MSTNAMERASTGVAGLDIISNSGVVVGTLNLIQGQPGTGKTTLSLQFLLAGAGNGERVLYIPFSESRREIELVATAHGWPLDRIAIRELGPHVFSHGDEASSPSIFHPADVELPHAIAAIETAVREVKPSRLVLDSLTELRNLAESKRHFRRALLRLKAFLEEHQVTSLLIDDLPDHSEAESIAHGVIRLERRTPAYGPVRRQLEIVKLRGVAFHDGHHDFVIARGGLEVFPRIRPKIGERRIAPKEIESGVAGLDRICSGGLDRATTIMVMGPSGAGKSTVVLQYALAAAAREESSAIFAFDEDIATIRERARSLDLPLESILERGRVRIHGSDAAELSPGEFSARVRAEVDAGASIVVLDSLNGYLLAMPEERSLVPHMHDLLSFLGRRGVTTFVVLTLAGLLEPERPTSQELSYLADTILLLRYFEATGAVRTSISVVKHRTADHERLIREFDIGRGGIRIGEPIVEFENVLAGTPRYRGGGGELLEPRT